MEPLDINTLWDAATNAFYAWENKSPDAFPSEHTFTAGFAAGYALAMKLINAEKNQ